MISFPKNAASSLFTRLVKGDVKFSDRQLNQFIDKFNENISATKATADALKKKGQSNEEKLIDAIKEMHKDLSKKLDDQNKK